MLDATMAGKIKIHAKVDNLQATTAVSKGYSKKLEALSRTRETKLQLT